MNTSVAKKTADVEPAEETTTERVAPLVRVECVKRNRAGSVWCEWHCCFPEGGSVADLADPRIWKRIQDNSGTALKRFDEIRILAFDASWVANCIVSYASLTEVILTKPVVTELPAQRENLHQDDLYAVQFDGVGYSVVRKRDGQRMTNSLVNPTLAAKALMDLYPTRVT